MHYFIVTNVTDIYVDLDCCEHNSDSPINTSLQYYNNYYYDETIIALTTYHTIILSTKLVQLMFVTRIIKSAVDNSFYNY